MRDIGPWVGQFAGNHHRRATGDAVRFAARPRAGHATCLHLIRIDGFDNFDALFAYAPYDIDWAQKARCVIYQEQERRCRGDPKDRVIVTAR